eukprot:8089427-Lingulodinium_polyedra.AAC.1
MNHVVHSTDDFLRRVPKSGLTGKLRTYDVCNLYPSIDRQHLLSCISPHIRKHVRSHGKASLLIELVAQLFP